MKRYAIEIFYKTGDSFKTHDQTSDLGMAWDNLEIAKANIQRIKEHHRWYESKYNNYYDAQEHIAKPSFVADKHDHSLKLLNDNREEWQLCAFWCGNFETLYSAKIKENEDSSLVYRTQAGGRLEDE